MLNLHCTECGTLLSTLNVQLGQSAHYNCQPFPLSQPWVLHGRPLSADMKAKWGNRVPVHPPLKTCPECRWETTHKPECSYNPFQRKEAV